MDDAELIPMGAPVLVATSSVIRHRGTVEEHVINKVGGRIWEENSYYMIRLACGRHYVVDLIDAHHTNGGTVRRLPD